MPPPNANEDIFDHGVSVVAVTGVETERKGLSCAIPALQSPQDMLMKGSSKSRSSVRECECTTRATDHQKVSFHSVCPLPSLTLSEGYQS